MRLTNPSVEDWRKYKAYRHIRELLFGTMCGFGGMALAFGMINQRPRAVIFALGTVIAFVILGVLETIVHDLAQQVNRYLND